MNEVIVITCPGCDEPGCIVCSKRKASRRSGLVLLLCDRCGARLSPEQVDLCADCDVVWESERGLATSSRALIGFTR